MAPKPVKKKKKSAKELEEERRLAEEAARLAEEGKDGGDACKWCMHVCRMGAASSDASS